MTRRLEVVEYDPAWPSWFLELRVKIWPVVRDFAVAIEHVGSTSVPGLAAKAIIDIDVVIPSRMDLPLAISQLQCLGYTHQGDLGIEDRDAFSSAEDKPTHNLYVCPRDSPALRNHLVFRDYLRSHPADASAYATLKKQLAAAFARNREAYVLGKTAFVESILKRSSFSAPSSWTR